MRPSVSIVIPAWNEEKTITQTLQALHRAQHPVRWWDELIVVDDGSTDHTADIAAPWADQLIQLVHHQGKGTALEAGIHAAKHDIIMMLDADLGDSATCARQLLAPILRNEADMTIAQFGPPRRKGGFGLVKALAIVGIYHLSGYRAKSPLSGQRAIRKKLFDELDGLSKGFGIEVGLTIDVARKGYRIVEVSVPFRHRETGRDLQGFIHRGKQFFSVGRTLIDKWWNPIC